MCNFLFRATSSTLASTTSARSATRPSTRLWSTRSARASSNGRRWNRFEKRLTSFFIKFAAPLIYWTSRSHTSLSCITIMYTTKSIDKVGRSWKSKQTQLALKMLWWHHNSATIFRPVRQCMWLMRSPLRISGARSILSAFVVPSPFSNLVQRASLFC